MGIPETEGFITVQQDGVTKSEEEATTVLKTKRGLTGRLPSSATRRLLLQSLWIGSSLFALGFVIAQRGPSFMDLQIITNSDVESASFFFTSSSVGYFVGSLVSGLAYERLNGWLVLSACVLGLSVTTCLLPWCSLFGMMVAIFFLNSVFAAGIDTCGSVKIIQLWGKDSRIAIQFVSFSFALGCVISPLVTEPFLAPILANETYLNVSNALAVLTLTQDNLTSQDMQVDLLEVTTDGSNLSSSQATFHASAGKTEIYYAFIISGAVVFLPFIPMILEWTRETSQSQKQKSRSEADTEKPNKQVLPMHAFIPVMAIVCVFFFLYCPVEDTFAYFLATFVVTRMHWSKSEGAQITSASMALFACFRFLNMFFVRCLTSTKHIITSCLTVIVCLLGFVIFAEHGVDVGVWVCAMGIGAGVSAIFPTGLSWIKEEFITVTGPVTSTVMISCSLGTMANPLLVGYLMQTFNPMWFPRVLLMEMCGCLCTFLFLLALSRCYLKKRYFLRGERSEEVNVTHTENYDIPS